MAISLFTLAVLGTVSFAASMVLGYRLPGDAAAMKLHFLLALGSTTLLVMAHSFIMFFLIATGVEMKTLEKERGWGDSFRKRTVAMKGRVFPIMTFVLLLVIAHFILGAAAHTRVIPTWIHGLLSWVTLAACLETLRREHAVLGDNNRLIEEFGTRRTSDRS